jgi:hypothetical protein
MSIPSFSISADLLGFDRVDGAHIDEGSTLLSALSKTVLAEYSSSNMWAIWDHCDELVTLCSKLSTTGSSLSSATYNLFNSSLVQIADEKVCISSLEKVLCHGLTHDSKSDETDFHICSP